MENILRPIYQERASMPNTLGIILVEKTRPVSPTTDNFDMILLVIVKHSEEPWFTKHYSYEGKIAAMHIVEETLLHYWIDTSTYRRAVEWIFEGKVVFDRNEYIDNLKRELASFPYEKRKLKMTIEFAKLIRSYAETKDLHDSGQYLDAYTRMVRCLHYLARLSIIEKGHHPEVTVWNQVRRIDSEVYKLCEEFIQSKEETDQRVQLMLLAVNVAINARSHSAAEHLLRVMRMKNGAWTFGELKNRPEVEAYAADLSALLNYLEEKEIIEAVLTETKGKALYHREYRIKEL
ncbi:nucleotidyltransferase-like protein [Terribacillus saccharophilus]|uniref:Nucleotidyltransferase-like n=1 Tax=Terribacillus saccharophilus TaxID=361277 RepID=A0AAX2EKN7_9BACI|nr:MULTISPECIES: nucleotidyltransferase-like protein [Terribacillus]MEC0282973.1 nucleotidyltransferase-like protein [Terribacillus saccharophilus]MEC0292174.1 nucleotidyltransferase-like protein [Terribacillus saccharophilus]SEO22451.1 Nucleotidyltransferase-like [Terribacillus saccharophilus]